ncbi:MAG: bifunctional DNA primase/polymerase [Pseudorhodobacter sp.]|nr:bifunctional DNA primase/polymerase [Frankiaceae bacterium]
MTPPPEGLDGEALHAHMTTLDDQQLSDLIAAVDAAEVISKAKTIDMGASARWYATKLAWPVFPLKPRGKKPLTAHGFKDATTDPERIASWWQQWPDANIGIPTGATDTGGCGYDVVDTAGRPGLAAWAAIKHATCRAGCCDEVFCPAPGPFDVRAMSFTPGDGVDRAPGRHLFIPATGKGNAAGLTVGIDYRGVGGFVVAAPSVGISGARYSWLTWPALPQAVEVAA